MSSTNACAKAKAGGVIVDVRTPEEFAGGHVDGAVNIPVDRLPSELDRLAELPGVSEEAYFAPSTKLEVLDIAVDALLAKRAKNPDGARPYEPSDYETGMPQ